MPRPQIIEAAKSRGESNLTERQEKVQIEIEKCHRRVEEFSEYSDLSAMQQYCKDVARWVERGGRGGGGDGWEGGRGERRWMGGRGGGWEEEESSINRLSLCLSLLQREGEGGWRGGREGREEIDGKRRRGDDRFLSTYLSICLSASLYSM